MVCWEALSEPTCLHSKAPGRLGWRQRCPCVRPDHFPTGTAGSVVPEAGASATESCRPGSVLPIRPSPGLLSYSPGPCSERGLEGGDLGLILRGALIPCGDVRQWQAEASRGFLCKQESGGVTRRNGAQQECCLVAWHAFPLGPKLSVVKTVSKQAEGLGRSVAVH